MNRLFYASLVVCTLAGPVLADSDVMLGDWYMDGTENGRHLQFVTHNGADGTFRKDIRDITDCEKSTGAIETGSWTYEDNTYTLITKMRNGSAVDPSQSYYNDSFSMKWTDSAHVLMYDPKTQVTWSLERVAADFRMPISDGCTV